jgi:hypothetical protein
MYRVVPLPLFIGFLALLKRSHLKCHSDFGTTIRYGGCWRCSLLGLLVFAFPLKFISADAYFLSELRCDRPLPNYSTQLRSPILNIDVVIAAGALR